MLHPQTTTKQFVCQVPLCKKKEAGAINAYFFSRKKGIHQNQKRAQRNATIRSYRKYDLTGVVYHEAPAKSITFREVLNEVKHVSWSVPCRAGVV